MTEVPIKDTWQDRVRKVYAYHISKVKEDKTWTIKETAKELQRSVGAVSQDINLYYYLRSYIHLETIEHYTKAIEWMNDKKSSVRSKL